MIPAWIMVARFGYRLTELAPISTNTSHMLVVLGMSLVLVVFQSVAGRGLQDLTEAHVSGDSLLFGMPLVFLWLVLEVGIVEEFFFRVLLQSRLSSAMRSELGGIVVMSLIFGLVHAPGLYLRTSVDAGGLGGPSLAPDGGWLFDRDHVSRWILPRRALVADAQLPGAHSGSRCHRPAAQYAAHSARVPHSEVSIPKFSAPK